MCLGNNLFFLPLFYTKPGFQEIFKGVIVHENEY